MLNYENYCNQSVCAVASGEGFHPKYEQLGVCSGSGWCNSQNLAPHLQVQLYEDFAKSRAKASVDESISSASAEESEKPKLKATGHVFQVGPKTLSVFQVQSGDGG